MTPPVYFEHVVAETKDLWDKLKDPVLAGPWKQLFAQVQSPRHVLSELLQNADDAGAKRASVRVRNDELVFEHDGEDFNEVQFRSLCRFGYSNKRNLHTVGFRGMGFKSTFSLGDQVRVQTPTLDVYFERERFTLPVWNNNAMATARTRVSVLFADMLREQQLRMNLEEWATSPVSLLFFRNLQELSIESHIVRKEMIGSGPVEGSQWLRLMGAKTEELLMIRSVEEAFPCEVVREIQQERNADDLHLPPCSVEVVLGLGGIQSLFVVLPTGTGVDLPFSINAPFVQDPARQKIKEPEVSPCNRWLLRRAGCLAGEAMKTWLQQERLTIQERARAYILLRGPVAAAADLKTSATKQVMDSMLSVIAGTPVILTTEDKLAAPGECTALPTELYEVWQARELMSIFAKTATYLLSPVVKARAREALLAHGWIKNVSADDALQALGAPPVYANLDAWTPPQPTVPVPRTWAQLQLLWNWAEQNIGNDWQCKRRLNLWIVPVQGQTLLKPGRDVIRVSTRGQQLSEADWNFISGLAHAMDPEWIGHLNKLKAQEGDGRVHRELTFLRAIGLHEPSPVDRIAAYASRRLLRHGKMPVEDYVRIAHIFAALDATVPEDFQYLTEDLHLRKIKEHPVVFDAEGEVDSLVPEAWAAEHILHSDYVRAFKSCTQDQWFNWAYSPKSKLHAFVPLTLQRKNICGRKSFVELVTSRGGESPKEYRYKNDFFIIGDFDFPAEVLQHWCDESAKNPKLWAAVVRGLLLDPLASWKNTLDVDVHQMSTQSTTSALSCGRLAPAWLIQLRSLACLPDTHGNPQTPPELMLRTPETESLFGIESFVAAELDDSPDKRKLLQLLGVRDTATGWEKVVERLRALTNLKDTTRVLADVLHLCEALDRIAMRCSPEDFNKLKAVFAAEALILSNSLEWLSSGELSLHADPEDDSPVVHSAIYSLAVWRRLGVPEQPVLEKSLEWLKTLAAGTRLEGVSYKRATVALARGGQRVWNELGHWLSLDQTWETVATLKYRVSKRSLTRWENLSVPTKRAAADLRMLYGEVAEEAPFTVTRPLAEALTMRVTNVETVAGRSRRIAWLQPLADGLCRVNLHDEAVTAKVREVARRLLDTTWDTVSRLEVTPYIDGTPTGEPLMPKVLWSDTKLYVMDMPTVRLMRELKEELTRPFGEAEVMEAVADCIDRDPEFVRDYLAANCELDPQVGLPTGDEKNEGKKKESERGKDENEVKPEDEEDGGDEPEITEEGESPTEGKINEYKEPKPDKSDRQKQPSFMDRYARGRGFRWHDAERCYTHANGAWIEKGEAPFNWHEHADGTGVTKRLFVVEATLAHGVEVPCELWRLMEINPDSIGLVLSAEDGEPSEWSASEIQKLKADGEILLYQSRFILKETPN